MTITSSQRLWILMAVFVLVSFAVSFTKISFDKALGSYFPEETISASAVNTGPSGVSGFRELLQKVNLDGSLWRIPYRKLRDTRGQLVVIYPEQSLADFEIDEILNWVSQGNQLVYLDSFYSSYSNKFLSHIKISLLRAKAVKDVIVPTLKELPVSQFAPEVKVSSMGRLYGNLRMIPVLTDQQGNLIVQLSYGKGQILLGTTADFVSNKRLADKGAWSNFQFLANWLTNNNKKVFFDERCHGFSQADTVMSTIVNSTAGLVLLQLMVILLVAVASAAQRFGQVKNVAITRKISNLEFISGIANTYQRAQATGLAAEVLSHNMRLSLAKHLHVSSKESDAIISGYYEQFGKDGLVARILAHSQGPFSISAQASTRNVSPEELIEMTKYCDKIQGILSKG